MSVAQPCLVSRVSSGSSMRMRRPPAAQDIQPLNFGGKVLVELVTQGGGIDFLQVAASTIRLKPSGQPGGVMTNPASPIGLRLRCGVDTRGLMHRRIRHPF